MSGLHMHSSDMTAKENQGVNFGLLKTVEVFNNQGYDAKEI